MIESELKPPQEMLLWQLMVSEAGGMFLKDLKSKPRKKQQRTALTSQGLTAEKSVKDPRTNSSCTYIELTEKGWAWCQDHLQTPVTSKSESVVVVFNRLRALLAAFFHHQNHCRSIGELILIANQPRESTSSDEPASTTPTADLRETIEQACLEVAGGRENVRVRLAELRPQLAQFSRDAVDEELLAMERRGMLSIWMLNDPTEITDADKAAALVTAGGNQNHIVYYGENS